MNYTDSTNTACKICGKQMTPTWTSEDICSDCLTKLKDSK